jgi:hypothetical protein
MGKKNGCRLPNVFISLFMQNFIIMVYFYFFISFLVVQGIVFLQFFNEVCAFFLQKKGQSLRLRLRGAQASLRISSLCGSNAEGIPSSLVKRDIIKFSLFS